MERAKTQIVLDADIIIHFSKAGKIQLLPEIFPEYDFVLLDIVKKELPMIFLPSLQTMIDRDKSVIEITFGESDGEKKNLPDLHPHRVCPSVKEKVHAWSIADTITTLSAAAISRTFRPIAKNSG